MNRKIIDKPNVRDYPEMAKVLDKMSYEEHQKIVRNLKWLETRYEKYKSDGH